MIMYIVTFHSYGRQGINNSGPVGVCQDLQRASEYVKEFLREDAPEDEEFDETLERYKFPGTPETDFRTLSYSIGHGLREIESYALDGPEEHYYESPMFTIWEFDVPEQQAVDVPDV